MYTVFPLILLLLFSHHHHHHHHGKGSRKWGSALRRILSFIHSLNNDSRDGGCPFQSFAVCVCVSLSLSVSIEYASRTDAHSILHTQMRTKETSYCLKRKKQHSRRRSCSYQFIASRVDACKKLSVLPVKAINVGFFLFLIDSQ